MYVISTTKAVNGDVLSFLIKLQVQTPKSCFWHYDSGYIKPLLCHVILQDHVIQESCNVMGRSSSI